MHKRDKCWKWKSEVYFIVDRIRMYFLLLCCTGTRTAFTEGIARKTRGILLLLSS